MTAGDNDIYLISFNEAGYTTKSLVVNSSFRVFFDFMYNENSIFWWQRNSKTIQRTWLNDQLTTVNAIHDNVTVLKQVYSIACDWYTKHVYWADYGYNHIKVSNMDGRQQRVLYSATIPRTLTVDPQNG